MDVRANVEIFGNQGWVLWNKDAKNVKNEKGRFENFGIFFVPHQHSQEFTLFCRKTTAITDDIAFLKDFGVTQQNELSRKIRNLRCLHEPFTQAAKV